MMNKQLKKGITILAIGIAGYIVFRFIKNKFIESELRGSESTGDNPKNPVVSNIGKSLYPKSEYVNVRESARVNNGAINNFIGKVMKGKEVGKVLGANIMGDGYIWYRVAVIGQNLTDDKDLGKAKKDSTTGYVREDNIVIK